MHLSHLTIENFRCFGSGEQGFTLILRPGLTALVGENDCGKSAIVDAIRLALGTADQEWYRLEDDDFYDGDTSLPIRIVCRFSGLSPADKRAFLEYLTYPEESAGEETLYVTWTAKDAGQRHRGRAFRRIEVCSGRDGAGPTFDPQSRQLLSVTYLRPLRDAEQALSAGRGSRLAQVLEHTDQVTDFGRPYRQSDLSRVLHSPRQEDEAATPPAGEIVPDDLLQLSLLGIVDLANDLLRRQPGVEKSRSTVDEHLSKLTGPIPPTKIDISGSDASDQVRVRQVLEKLELSLGDTGRTGLGSNNLLFIACELLLLSQEGEGNRMLLIEEPEAHLHPQRQLRLMQYLQHNGEKHKIQVIVTTHSPNLASVVKLDNLVIVQGGQAFPLATGHTKLAGSDYRFLERFLDVTKANLFFARGVVIVEGDAENLLLPTLAELLGRDFTEHSVSIVNVGGIGLRRYSRIFLRQNEGNGQLATRVACVTDMDVMPNCAPPIIGRAEAGVEWPSQAERKWRAKSDYSTERLQGRRSEIESKAFGQSVRTFVSDEWTLEYDLALGLPEDVYVATELAKQDEALAAGLKQVEVLEAEALNQYAAIEIGDQDGCTADEVRAATIYAPFVKERLSKPIAAQYLAERLRRRVNGGELNVQELRRKLPRYLVAAIDYVTQNDKAGTGSA